MGLKRGHGCSVRRWRWPRRTAGTSGCRAAISDGGGAGAGFSDEHPESPQSLSDGSQNTPGLPSPGKGGPVALLWCRLLGWLLSYPTWTRNTQ